MTAAKPAPGLFVCLRLLTGIRPAWIGPSPCHKDGGLVVSLFPFSSSHLHPEAGDMPVINYHHFDYSGQVRPPPVSEHTTHFLSLVHRSELTL